MANFEKADKILELLHKNCKLSLEQMSTMLEMPAAEIAEIIDALEKQRVILGYGAKVDWEKAAVQDTVTAYILFSIISQNASCYKPFFKPRKR